MAAPPPPPPPAPELVEGDVELEGSVVDVLTDVVLTTCSHVSSQMQQRLIRYGCAHHSPPTTYGLLPRQMFTER